MNQREQRNHKSTEHRTSSKQQHDHAWIRLHPGGQRGLVVGEYRCQLCAVVWRL